MDLEVTVSLNITTNLLFLGTAKLFSIVTEMIHFFLHEDFILFLIFTCVSVGV